MPLKIIIRLTMVLSGIALLIAGLFFDMSAAASSTPQAGATATPDRLAQPTLPASPSQADHGAQVYWLSCLPCHGDRGQGLTDEFRETYPPEDRYCWNSGCHGERPYDNGFKLPMSIPAVVGPETLQKFPNASVLQAYIKSAMPFWKPGSLTDEDSWQVTAFLLRQNGLWEDSQELTPDNAAAVPVSRAHPTPERIPDPTPGPTQFNGEQATGPGAPLGLIVGGAAALVVVILVTKLIRRRQP